LPNEGSEPNSRGLALSVAFVAAKDVNVQESLGDWAAMTLAREKLGEDGFDTIDKNKASSKFYDWMNSSLESCQSNSFIGTVPNIGVQMSIRKLVKEKAPDFHWSEVTVDGASKATLDVLQTVYRFQCVSTKTGSTNINALVFGAAEVRMYVKGSEQLGGIPLPTDPTVSFKDWFANINTMGGADLAKLLESPGAWTVACGVGDVVAIPSGFMICSLTPGGCMYFRKSVTPNHEGENARVLQTVTSLMECHPELARTSWNGWHTLLSQC
jgi:hypothetical protein